MRHSSPISRQPHSTLWAALALVAITAAVYAPVLGHHFIESWDDTPAILTNPDYNPPTFGKLLHYWVPPPTKTFYVPVTYTLWGLLAMISRSSAPPGLPFNPAYFYSANLLSHALAAGMVFLILIELIGHLEKASPARVPLQLAAWLGAAFFSVHPVQVEGVATASSVYTPLSGMFGFLAVWQYLICSRKSFDRPGPPHFAWGHYALASAAYLLALLTKPTAVAVPLVIAVIEWVLRKRKPWTLAMMLWPWIGLAVVVILLNQHASPGATVFVPDPPWRFMVPLDAIGFYLWKVIAPVRLASDYGRSPRWFVDHPAAWLTCLVPLALAAIAWLFRRRTVCPLAALGVFVAGLLPSIGIVPFDYQHYSTVADRYMYIAMLGPAMAVTFLAARFGRIAAGITIAVLGILTMLTIVQLSYWRDDWHLMAHTLKVNPNSLGATSGFQYLLTGWEDHGFPAPRQCTINQTSLVEVGNIMMERHRWLIAIAAYQRALTLGPPSAAIYDRLGRALLGDIKPAAAREAFSSALRLDPRDSQAQKGLSQVETMQPAPATTRPE